MAEPEPSTSKRIHFNHEMDVRMLALVSAENPFLYNSYWDLIAGILAENFNLPFSARNVRERVQRLTRQFRAKENESKKKSGVVEEYDSKDLMLTQIAQMETESIINKYKLKEKKKDDNLEKAKAQEIRDVALQGLGKRKPTTTDNNTDVPNEEEADGPDVANVMRPKTPKKTKPNDESTLEFLAQKAQTDAEIRREELQLRREELQLHRDQLEMEKEERKNMWKLLLERNNNNNNA